MKQKAIFIVPGYRHGPKNKAYKKIAHLLKKEGYKPILLNIPWKRTTISQNIDYFLKVYNKISTKKKYILGFSYGAMIAFIASTKINTSGLILCSLSPYFKEDLPRLPASWTSKVMKQRYQDFSRLQCAALAKQVKTKQILMLYGTKEEKSLVKRVNKAFEQIESCEKYLIPIREVEHNIGDKRYLYTIHQAVGELN